MRHAYINLFLVVTVFVLANCNQRRIEPRKRDPGPSAGFSVDVPNDGVRGSPTPSKPGGITILGNPSCIANLKQKTVDGKLRFIEQSNSSIDDGVVKDLNEKLDLVKYKENSFTISRMLKDGQIISLGFSGSTAESDFSVSIKGESSDSNFAYGLELNFEAQDGLGRRVQTFSQAFNISPHCQLQLKTMQKTLYEYVTDKKIKITYSDYYSDTGDKEETKEFKLKENEYLKINFGFDLEEFKKTDFENGRVFFSREIPFARIKVNKVKENITLKNELTHSELKGFEIDLSYLVDGVKMADIRVQNAEPLISRTIYQNKETLKIDKNIWMQLTPKIAVKGSRTVEVSISTSILESQNDLSLKITYKNELDWKLLEPYWQVLTKSENEVQIRNQKVNIKKSLAWDSQFDNTQQYLQKTEFIQTELSQIQNWAVDLKKGFSGTRIDLAVKILKLINKNLVYDHASLKNNIIRPLNTQEILDKRTGVCQHYANLFVTLARALGLPSRIITGYFLSPDYAGPHAWVEIETEKNAWLPIEPQSSELKKDFKKYLPIAISGGLDDPKNVVYVAKEIKALTESMKIQIVD
jgi:hypothetical protein